METEDYEGSQDRNNPTERDEAIFSGVTMPLLAAIRRYNGRPIDATGVEVAVGPALLRLCPDGDPEDEEELVEQVIASIMSIETDGDGELSRIAQLDNLRVAMLTFFERHQANSVQ